MHVLSIQPVGGDAVEKHGISTLPSSRLGWIAVLFMACLGLSEDLKADLLSPLVRLAAQLVFMGGILLANGAYIPDSLGFTVIDYFFGIALIGYLQI